MGIEDSTYIFAQWIFIKFLAITYFLAFGSLYLQIKGLYGSNGVLPIHEFLTAVESNYGPRPYRLVPSLFWWIKPTDDNIQHVCILGMVGAVLIFIGVYPAPLFLFLWVTYLSFVSVGSVFLAFQWDILLLEIGFIAIFFSLQSPPSILLVFLLWILLFRFMLSSGAVKLLSKCPEWRCIKAMTYHFQTQPIPNKLAYYMHNLPKTLLKVVETTVFFVELAIPFMIFLPPPFRLAAFWILILFQIAILLTGNFAFFNILTITLCIPLLDDRYLQGIFDGVPSISALSPSLFSEIFLGAVAIALILLNVLEFLSMYFSVGEWFFKLRRYLSPYHFVNPYGLFARMTTVRNEIIIEGSQDGEKWKAYEFKWKPGDVTTPPQQIAPHQPRLDWQMWFAALSSYKHNPWFFRLLTKLFEDSPDVMALLKRNPFPKKPPRFIRAMVYQYRFSTLEEKKKTGQWWIREQKGHYSPVYTNQKDLAEAPPESASGFSSL